MDSWASFDFGYFIMGFLVIDSLTSLAFGYLIMGSLSFWVTDSCLPWPWVPWPYHGLHGLLGYGFVGLLGHGLFVLLDHRFRGLPGQGPFALLGHVLLGHGLLGLLGCGLLSFHGYRLLGLQLFGTFLGLDLIGHFALLCLYGFPWKWHLMLHSDRLSAVMSLQVFPARDSPSTGQYGIILTDQYEF